MTQAHIVVGVDTGKVSALACLDLQGRVIALSHDRYGGAEWLIKTITKYGVPVVIATDRQHANSMLKKLRATFSAALFEPSKDITIEEKRKLARAMSIKNQHERDAYAAAKAAYNSYANKLNQAAAIAAQNSTADIDAIKAKVIARYSINEALYNKSANRKR